MSISARRVAPWYPPEFNEEFKEMIRKRDKNICAGCRRKMEKLDIHHIDYTKYTVPENCISLCRECHTYLHSLSWTRKNEAKRQLHEIARERSPVVA